MFRPDLLVIQAAKVLNHDVVIPSNEGTQNFSETRVREVRKALGPRSRGDDEPSGSPLLRPEDSQSLPYLVAEGLERFHPIPGPSPPPRQLAARDSSRGAREGRGTSVA